MAYMQQGEVPDYKRGFRKVGFHFQVRADLWELPFHIFFTMILLLAGTIAAGRAPSSTATET